MLRTTEWDLHELLRDLFERLIHDVQQEYDTYGQFLELVRDEDVVTLWLGDEDSRGRGARFEARARYETQGPALVLELATEGGMAAGLFRVAEVSPGSREWVSNMGTMRKDALKRLYDHLAQTGGLERLFYAVRTSAPAENL